MSQQGNNDNSNDLLYGLTAVVILVTAFFYFYGHVIYKYILLLKYYELSIINIVYTDNTINKIMMAISNTESFKKEWNIDKFLVYAGKASFYTNFLILPFIIFISYYNIKNNRAKDFKRVLNMKTLAKSESRIWPFIAPVLDQDIINKSIYEGEWAMAKNPVNFCRHYKLLDDSNQLIEKKAEKIFAAQLGKLWDGHKKLPKHVKALFVIFAAKGCGDKSVSDKYIEKIALDMAYNRDKIDYSWADKLIEKYIQHEEVQQIIKSHAYISTIMASMLEFARTQGVLPSSYFIWLKPMDRKLWYILNGVGRKVAFCEISGIYAHWIAEKVAMEPIEKPYVSKAVSGLLSELKMIKITNK